MKHHESLLQFVSHKRRILGHQMSWNVPWGLLGLECSSSWSVCKATWSEAMSWGRDIQRCIKWGSLRNSQEFSTGPRVGVTVSWNPWSLFVNWDFVFLNVTFTKKKSWVLVLHQHAILFGHPTASARGVVTGTSSNLHTYHGFYDVKVEFFWGERQMFRQNARGNIYFVTWFSLCLIQNRRSRVASLV